MDLQTAPKWPVSRKIAARCLILPALVLPVLLACEKKQAQAPPPAPKVTVDTPVRRNVTDYLELTGTTQAINTVQLRARVEGYLEKVLFKDGELVKSGQPLFVIQKNTYEAKLQQAEGAVQTQKASLEHAKTELARYTSLFNQKAAAQTDVENWRYQRDSAQAALASAEAQRDLAKLDLAYTIVYSPFNGRIDRRLKDPGNLVGSGESTVLAEISQIDPLYVYFNLSETDLARLRQETGIEHVATSGRMFVAFMGITGEQGYPHQGYLDFASTSVSPTTGTLLLRGVFPNGDGKMLPGQFARVRVPVGVEQSALLVPRAARGFDQLGPYVLIVNDRNVVERRNVKEGPIKGDQVVIEEGLKGDELIIVKGLLKAAPGRQVVPERQSPGQAPEMSQGQSAAGQPGDTQGRQSDQPPSGQRGRPGADGGPGK